ncbi:hypothetical protein HPB49_019567 [Dermacentor silvarum]|uniref:Uncharacterized protein n=1 Tax=Dermacentor silvarum TaxID=543639 RepID=A0ACB8C546_DERSI|nr:hypothetical protein HPB49_019567 [Dermacentor silvarum]
MRHASSLLVLLALSAFRCCGSTKLVAKRLQVHRVRLHDSLVMPCAAKEGVTVTQARWTDQAGGTSWLSQALLSVSTGHLRFPKVAAVLSGYYECSGYVRLPRREVFIKVRHEIQVFDSDKNETGCRVGYVISEQRCCEVSRAWSSEQRVRTIIMEDKLSRFFQDRFHVESVHREVQTEPYEPMPPASSTFLEKRVAASSKAKVAAPPDQETMFKELLAKTAPNARRLDRRKNTPQPRHLGRSTLKAVGGSHRTLQKSPLAARQPPNEFSSWRPPNRSAQRTPRKTGAVAPVMSPPAETLANLYGRPSRRSAQREFENTSRYKLPVWPSSPEDHRRTSHGARTRDDVPRDVHGFYEAAECDVSDGSHRSFPPYGRSGHGSPRRSPYHLPLGREDRQDHLSSVVSPLPRGYKMAHSLFMCIKGKPNGGQFGIVGRTVNGLVDVGEMVDTFQRNVLDEMGVYVNLKKTKAFKSMYR